VTETDRRQFAATSTSACDASDSLTAADVEIRVEISDLSSGRTFLVVFDGHGGSPYCACDGDDCAHIDVARSAAGAVLDE
jgi:hypothetical protein